ncbi:MAG: septum site-determining protein MinD [Chloroflexi bacterium RBG_13_56_8]|nr:MAG: septum site-determining protein MinD [Chloroflexi bacterium RBG_13_56_8]
MPTRVITITSGKGGVGKTTTTANLGVALATLNQRVVVIDTDIGLRNLDVVMGLQNRIIYDLVDSIEGRCRLRQALIRDKVLSNLYLLPAAQTRDKSSISPADMVRVCAQLRGECDFVLIDSPAGIDAGFRNAVAPADEFILVSTPDRSAVQDVDRVLGIIETEGRGTTSLVINRLRADLVKRNDMLDPAEILEMLAIDLLGIVPESEEVLVANGHGTPVAHEQRCAAARAYHQIAHRLLGERVPHEPLLTRQPTLLERLLFWKRAER